MTPAEIGSYDYGFLAESPYSGPVFVVTGDEDPLYCLEAYGSCDDILKGGAILFPRAKSYDYYVAAKTGHATYWAGLGAGYPRGCAQLAGWRLAACGELRWAEHQGRAISTLEVDAVPSLALVIEQRLESPNPLLC